jgi:4-hydroxyphenylpyruvate dioxygenase
MSPDAIASNPLGIRGIEFIEFTSSRPEELGAVLTRIGFRLLARHCSRQVFLYRQGDMNLIVNADPTALISMAREGEDHQISALAFRVDHASQAYERCMQWGAWPIPTRAGAMELNIPGIHGVGDTIIYLVDHLRPFSIYDIDFVYLDDVHEVPPVVPGLHFFGLVQYIALGRSAEWIDFYAQLFGFRALPPDTHFGILPHGTILESPCGCFYLQLVEPVGDALYDTEWYEQFARLAFGVPDVLQAVRLLESRGVPFQDNAFIHTDTHGAITSAMSYDVTFELVRHHAPTAAAPEARP